MTNLEYLEKAKRIDDDRSKNLNEFPERVSEWEIEYRKMKALEIIAEEIITLSDTVTTLENIETAIRQR